MGGLTILVRQIWRNWWEKQTNGYEEESGLSIGNNRRTLKQGIEYSMLKVH